MNFQVFFQQFETPEITSAVATGVRHSTLFRQIILAVVSDRSAEVLRFRQGVPRHAQVKFASPV